MSAGAIGGAIAGATAGAAAAAAAAKAKAEEASGRHEAIFHVYRGDASGGHEVEYRVPVETGMVVLDAIHWI